VNTVIITVVTVFFHAYIYCMSYRIKTPKSVFLHKHRTMLLTCNYKPDHVNESTIQCTVEDEFAEFDREYQTFIEMQLLRRKAKNCE